MRLACRQTACTFYPFFDCVQVLRHVLPLVNVCLLFFRLSLGSTNVGNRDATTAANFILRSSRQSMDKPNLTRSRF